MDGYPTTRGEALEQIQTFVRKLKDGDLREALIGLHDMLPRSTAHDFIDAGLELLSCRFGGPYPDASRDLLACALDFAFAEGGDLGPAAHTFMTHHTAHLSQPNEVTLDPAGLERTLREILEGGEEDPE